MATQEGMSLPMRTGLSGDALESYGDTPSKGRTRHRKPPSGRWDVLGVLLGLIMGAALGGWITALLGIFAWENPVITTVGVIAAMAAATVLIIGSIALLFHLLTR